MKLPTIDITEVGATFRFENHGAVWKVFNCTFELHTEIGYLLKEENEPRDKLFGRAFELLLKEVLKS